QRVYDRAPRFLITDAVDFEVRTLRSLRKRFADGQDHILDAAQASRPGAVVARGIDAPLSVDGHVRDTRHPPEFPYERLEPVIDAFWRNVAANDDLISEIRSRLPGCPNDNMRAAIDDLADRAIEDEVCRIRVR